MTDRETTLQDALRGLSWLADHVGDLWEAVTGHGRVTGRYPGSSCPLNVAALDLHVDLLARADLLHERIAQTVGHDRLESPSSAYASPGPYLRYCLELLSEATVTDTGFLADCAWIDATRLAVAVLLGEAVEGRFLDAVCPFCLGYGPASPAGGAKTLVFRRIARRAALVMPGDDDDTEMVIVCESGTCSPLEAEVGIWTHGNPAWPWSQWDWLAARLRVAG